MAIIIVFVFLIIVIDLFIVPWVVTVPGLKARVKKKAGMVTPRR